MIPHAGGTDASFFTSTNECYPAGLLIPTRLRRRLLTLKNGEVFVARPGAAASLITAIF